MGRPLEFIGSCQKEYSGYFDLYWFEIRGSNYRFYDNTVILVF